MTEKSARTPRISCPQCGKEMLWDPQNSWRPFCSERCKLIDLGQWASEAYRIPDTTPPSSDDSSQS